MAVGVFGGTFDPVHVGHLRAAEEAREAFSMERIYFVPARIQPLKQLAKRGGSRRQSPHARDGVPGATVFSGRRRWRSGGGASPIRSTR